MVLETGQQSYFIHQVVTFDDGYSLKIGHKNRILCQIEVHFRKKKSSRNFYDVL